MRGLATDPEELETRAEMRASAANSDALRFPYVHLADTGGRQFPQTRSTSGNSVVAARPMPRDAAGFAGFQHGAGPAGDQPAAELIPQFPWLSPIMEYGAQNTGWAYV
jgi:hypothetical protein